jgi:hypothetical protein
MHHDPLAVKENLDAKKPCATSSDGTQGWMRQPAALRRDDARHFGSAGVTGAAGGAGWTSTGGGG